MNDLKSYIRRNQFFITVLTLIGPIIVGLIAFPLIKSENQEIVEASLPLQNRQEIIEIALRLDRIEEAIGLIRLTTERDLIDQSAQIAKLTEDYDFFLGTLEDNQASLAVKIQSIIDKMELLEEGSENFVEH